MKRFSAKYIVLMGVLMRKINVSLFIDLTALYMNTELTFVSICGLMVIGNKVFTYSAWEFYYHLVR